MPDEISSHTQETGIPVWVQRGDAENANVPGAIHGQLPYDEYLRQRHAFIEAGQRGRQRLDQLLVAGATGALILSVTFLEKIAPSPSVTTRPFLLVGWSLLLIALGISMLGYEASTRAFEDGVRGLDRQQSTGTPYSPAQNVWDARTKLLNRISLIVFFLGILALVAFAFFNVPFRAHARRQAVEAPAASPAAKAVSPSPTAARPSR